MILIDVNLLLYAYDKASPHNKAAAEWLEQIMSEQELVGLPWATMLAFLRISTHRRAPKPLPLSVAIDTMRDWLLRPSVSIVHPGERHWSILSQLLQASQARGALVTDAHLAALATEQGATLCTNDKDFTRFAGLRMRNPLETRGS